MNWNKAWKRAAKMEQKVCRLVTDTAERRSDLAESERDAQKARADELQAVIDQSEKPFLVATLQPRLDAAYARADTAERELQTVAHNLNITYDIPGDLICHMEVLRDERDAALRALKVARDLISQTAFDLHREFCPSEPRFSECDEPECSDFHESLAAIDAVLGVGK